MTVNKQNGAKGVMIKARPPLEEQDAGGAAGGRGRQACRPWISLPRGSAIKGHRHSEIYGTVVTLPHRLYTGG